MRMRCHGSSCAQRQHEQKNMTEQEKQNVEKYKKVRHEH